MKKLRVGLFSFTSCEGCFMELLNYYSQNMPDLEKKIEFAHARVLREKNSLEGLDIALVEGAIATRHDVERLREIRKNSKLLVCFGSCAIEGWPSNQRNKFSKTMQRAMIPRIREYGQFDKVMQPSDFVRVDASLAGCPIPIQKFAEFLDSHSGGK